MSDLLLRNICRKEIMNENDIWGSVLYDGNKAPRGLAHRIAKIAYHKLNGESGEVDLIVTILIRSAKDRDLDFLHSDTFEYYTELLGLNPTVIRDMLLRVINYIDHGVGRLNDRLL